MACDRNMFSRGDDDLARVLGVGGEPVAATDVMLGCTGVDLEN